MTSAEAGGSPATLALAAGPGDREPSAAALDELAAGLRDPAAGLGDPAARSPTPQPASAPPAVAIVTARMITRQVFMYF
jgi:hypothetical protein